MAAVLVVVAGLVWWGYGAALPPAERATDHGAARIAKADVASSASPTVSTAATGRTEIATDRLDRTSANSSETGAATPPSETPLTIVVVDGATKLPVPHAEVFVGIDESTPQASRLVHAVDVRAEYLDSAERHGTAWRADGAGEVRLPRPAGRRLVTARHGAKFGHAPMVDAGATRMEVTLADDSTLRVRVVDGAGVPRAGVPLSLRMPESGRAVPATKHLGVTAGADGLCVVRHFQTMVDTIQMQERETIRTAEVVTRGPGLAGPGVWIDVRQPPSDVVVVHLPSAGSLRVRVRDDAGAPFPHDVAIVVVSLPAPANVIEAIRAQWREVVPAGVGEQIAAPLGLGAKLRITATVMEPPFERLGPANAVPPDPGSPPKPSQSLVREVPGPLLHGEVVDVEFVFGENAARLRGRLIDAGDHTRLVDTKFRCRIVCGQHGATASGRTADDGRFEILVPPALSDLRLTDVQFVVEQDDASLGGGTTVDAMLRKAQVTELHDVALVRRRRS